MVDRFQLDAAMGPASYAAGAMASIAEQIETGIHVRTASGAMAMHAATIIGLEVDSIAGGGAKTDTNSKNPLGHVYEWGDVGNPTARLFRFDVATQGGAATVTWRFVESRRFIPTPEQYGFPNAEMLSDKRYIFAQKARILEYGESVHIYPIDGDKIYVPHSPEPGKYRFSPNEVVHHSDGPNVHAFSDLYEAFAPFAAKTSFELFSKKEGVAYKKAAAISANKARTVTNKNLSINFQNGAKAGRALIAKEFTAIYGNTPLHENAVPLESEE